MQPCQSVQTRTRSPARTAPPAPQGPRVEIPQTTFEALQAICAKAHEQRTETHWYLVGERQADRIYILEVVRAGSPTEHAALTRPDLNAAADALAPLLEEGYAHLGEGHLHPDELRGPSRGDLQTLRNIDQEQWPGYLCQVATYTQNDGLVITCHSITPGGVIQEHPVSIVPDEDVDSRLFYNPNIPLSRSHSRILHLGLGSGGGNVAQQESKMNPHLITLVDHDRFEGRNLQRHIVGKGSIGKLKTTVMKRILQHGGTTARIRTCNREINPANLQWLEREFRRHDLVVNCTGHPAASVLISDVARRTNRTVIHGFVLKKGKGGGVFRQLGHPSAPCYACIFNLTRKTVTDDAQTLDALTRAYGFTPEELERQVGLWTDVSMISTVQAKIVLETLKRAPTPRDANLWLVNNRTLSISHFRIAQDQHCPSCHPETIGDDDAITAPIDHQKGA